MRITTRIATAGKSGLSRFPVPDIDIDDCKDDSHIPIVLIDGKNCEGFFAQASETNEWFNRRDKALAELEPLRAKRVSCPNRRIDFCSGLHTDCPLYRNGRCMEPELPDDLKE